jgi:hypothetical protein
MQSKVCFRSCQLFIAKGWGWQATLAINRLSLFSLALVVTPSLQGDGWLLLAVLINRLI